MIILSIYYLGEKLTLITSPFRDPNLAQLYFDILRELSIYNGYRNIIIDNKQMILITEYSLSPGKKEQSTKFVFHPLIENESLCSLLVLEDSIYRRLSLLIKDTFEIVLAKKSNLNMENYKQNNLNNDDIKQLSICEKYTIPKWNNLYRIITSTAFTRDLISFSLDLSEDLITKITFDYPLYSYLVNIKDNTIFGIKFSNTEITLLKQIYEIFIINLFEKELNKTIYIPSNSNKFPKFYSLLKLYLEITELIHKEYHIKRDRVKKINFDNINSLNKYVYEGTDLLNLETLNEIQKFDKEAYRNELQKRKESSPKWLLLKDNIVQKNQLTVQNNDENFVETEILDNYYDKQEAVVNLNKLFSFLSDENAVIKYKKSLNEILSLAQKNNNINDLALQKEFNKKLEKQSELNDIYAWQNKILSIINQYNICIWKSFKQNKICYRVAINEDILSDSKDEVSKSISGNLNETLIELLNKNNYNKYKIDDLIEIKIIDTIEDLIRERKKDIPNNILRIYIFSSKLLIIQDEVFEPKINGEFLKFIGNYHLNRNIFNYTNFLEIRLKKIENIKVEFGKSNYYMLNNKNILEKIETENHQVNSFEFKYATFKYLDSENNEILLKDASILNFIFHLLNNNEEHFHYVINWLAYFFRTLNKTKTALVLLGDKEATEEIFFDKIILKIFGEKYCSIINDDKLKEEEDTNSIFKQKVFYNFRDITENNSNKNKIDKQLTNILIYDSFDTYKIKNHDKEFKKNDLVPKIYDSKLQSYGQVLITSDDSYHFIKRSYSKCTVFKVNDSLGNIIAKLGSPDIASFYEMIENDLTDFCNLLSVYPVHGYFANNTLETDARYELDRTLINNDDIKDDDLDKLIDEFISALKKTDRNYFKRFDDANYFKIYKNVNYFENNKYTHSQFVNELEDCLDNNMIVQKRLYLYFNVINGKEFFTDNLKLLNILKGKEELFKQCIDKKDYEINGIFNSEHKTSSLNDKQYKIKNYTLKKNHIKS